ncbi:MAG TPA: ATP-binding protein [Gemmataceae bacterium]|nr:ATP-binding protein [Gemmataceae bacterium]
MAKVNILLVDDQPGKLLSYQAILGDLGENLVLVNSGREALQYLLRNECALILLDVVMPEMDGFETASMIRQRPRLERTPIIFVTAFSTSDLDRLKGYELGAVDYVFAPIVPEILRAKVSVFVELYRNRRELATAMEQLRSEIAERERAQEQALQAERLAAIGQMVAGLAHESRNALQQTLACVEMLRRRVTDATNISLIDGIQKAQDRLHHLLEEVRQYAAPVGLTRDRYDLAEVWRSAWSQLAPIREGRNVHFVEDSSSLTLECLVDPFAIEQVFRNVFENAMAASGDPVKIEVACSEADLGGLKAARIRVADNGTGLSEEQKQRIFEPFYTTKTRGTGLGMAIAKRIVEAHGGKIAVADHYAGGTAIELVLPRGLS